MKPSSARLSRLIVPSRLERPGRYKTRYPASDFGMAHTKLRISGVVMAITPFLFAQHCLLYHGFEISPEMAEEAHTLWEKERIDNAQIFICDAAEAVVEEEFYDLVFCLYFTPGNIRDKSDDLSLYSDAYLDRNPRFIQTISRFYRALKVGGSAFFTMYKDVPETEAAQVDFYEHTGQRVVTALGSRFVATAEGFWSARWTRDSIASNLGACGIRSRGYRVSRPERHCVVGGGREAFSLKKECMHDKAGALQ